MLPVYVVEVIRAGDPKLGVHMYKTFERFEDIEPEMREYNIYRGYKYPAYYVNGDRYDLVGASASSRNCNHLGPKTYFPNDDLYLCGDCCWKKTQSEIRIKRLIESGSPRYCPYCKVDFREDVWAYNSDSRRCENCYQYALQYATMK